MKRIIIRVVSGALFAACVLAPLSHVAAENSHAVAAAEFVDTLGARTVSILYATENAQELRNRRLHDVFSSAFGLQKMAKAVVRNTWKDTELRERHQYYDLFGIFMLANTARLLDTHEPDSFEVTETKKIEAGKISVTTDVTKFGVPMARIDWIVENTGAGYRITDIILNKVSTVHTYRAEFGSVIRREGFDGLIAALQAKNRH